MPPKSRQAPGVSSLRGSLAGGKRLRLVSASGRKRGSAPVSPVHELQGRIRRAFAIDTAPEVRAPTPLEQAMRQARTIHRANVEGVRAAILSGELTPASAGRWITSDVETCIVGMLGAVLHDLQTRFGETPGGLAVLGMGKLGGRELSLGSDVDLIFVCEADADKDSERLQAAVEQMSQALAWSPASGRLYDLDMRLRPFGSDGPLATPYRLFSRYYRTDRWIWELQSLLRARVIGDDSPFGRRLAGTVRQALRSAPSARTVLREIADMRRLMAQEQPAKSRWDLKRLPGGLTDLEFTIQGLQLAHAPETAEVLEPGTAEAIEALWAAGVLAPPDAALAVEALNLFATIRQIQGALGCPGGDLKLAPGACHEAILASLEVQDWTALRRRLDARRSDVRGLFRRVFGAASVPREAV